MSQTLDKLLGVLQSKLPDTKSAWISDLRAEAAHIPAGFSRLRFQWSGLLAAIAHLLRVRVGVRKMGQILLATALSIFFLAGLIYTMNAPHDGFTKLVLNFTLPLYVIAAVFAVTSLGMMKRFTLACSILWAVAWWVFGLGVFDPSSMPIEFLRAIAIEAAFIMASLFIAASYLGWVEERRHV